MSGLSNFYATSVANHFFRGDAVGTSQPQPRVLYLALHAEDPTDAGKSVDEILGGSYIRQIISFNAPVTDADNVTTITNTSRIHFAGLPNCVVKYMAIWTDQLAGTMVWSAPVIGDGATPSGEYEFNANDSFTIESETLEIVVE